MHWKAENGRWQMMAVWRVLVRGRPHALASRMFRILKVLSPISPTGHFYYDTNIGFKLSIMIAYQPTLMVAVLRRANKARQSTRLVACNCLKQWQKAAKLRSILS